MFKENNAMLRNINIPRHDGDMFSIKQAKTMEDYSDMQVALSNAQENNSYRLVLSRVGGHDYKDCVKNLLNKCMSEFVMANLNMDGKKKQKGQNKKTLQGVTSIRLNNKHSY